MFENHAAFRPDRDSKIPVRRTRTALVLRSIWLIGELLFSRHPEDCWTWLRSMYARKRPLSYAIPWLTFDAIRTVSPAAKPGSRIFEYGSGHSTLYWKNSGASVVSVESNEKWYRYLRVALGEQDRVDLILATNEHDYVTAIDGFSADYFDIVLVDGAFRRQCVLASITHVRPGGLLVVDNTDWHWFRAFPLAGIPQDWTPTVCAGYAPMLGHKSETTIWRKPQRAASIHD